jgi:CSLREA domain-containing protein
VASHRWRVVALGLGLGVGLVLLFGWAQRPHVAQATTIFTVTSTGDGPDTNLVNPACDDGSGSCTLRAAIMQANNAAGAYIINFAIAPTGTMKTISPTTANGPLPFLTSNVTIDGSTQTGGFVGIELSGLSCAGCLWGLNLAATGTVKGMVVNNFTSGGGIVIAGPAGGSTVTNNFIGTNTAAGGPAKPNAAGVIVVGSSGNNIGPGNTISGNSAIGVWITSCPPPPFAGCGVASSNLIFSNAIGTDGCCTYAVPNGIGVDIDGTSTNGTALAVSGNRVGVDGLGGNTIAGNSNTGVVIAGGMATGNSIEANLIGNAYATTAIPNGGAGVCICGASSNVVGPNNNVAGNTGPGVLITEYGGVGATGNSVQQTSVGTRGDGYGALPNGGAGVEIAGAGTQPVTGNTVGCALVGCGISIGANGLDGVYIHGAMASSNLVAHASIGEFCHGDCFTTATHLPDGRHGVYISGGAHDNLVGGLNTALTGNDIAYNHGAGFAVDGGGARNQIIGTTVHDNDGLGIDVDPLGSVTATNGALTSALYCPGCASGGLVSITGYFRGAIPGTYRVDAFFNLTCDPSGYGEGARPMFGTWYAPANAVFSADGDLSGAGAITNFTPTAGIATLADTVGKPVTADATLLSAPGGATTEYSKCLSVTADADSDGIADSIDPAPAMAGDCFSDTGTPGGVTFGCIVNRHGCYVSVVDLPNPDDGVVIGNVCPGVAPADAEIFVCGIATVHVVDGGSLTDKCGSFRSGVDVGPLGVDFGPYFAQMQSHTSFVIEDLRGNQTQFTLQNLPTSAKPIDVEGIRSVLPGTTANFGAAVGGVSEAPAAATLPSAASPPGGRNGLLLAGAALGLAALAMAAGAQLLRRLLAR